jgi:hypothetical protein
MFRLNHPVTLKSDFGCLFNINLKLIVHFNPQSNIYHYGSIHCPCLNFFGGMARTLINIFDSPSEERILRYVFLLDDLIKRGI